ncbi:MAG TPA: response regulator [Kofleriaceae bacterium]|nr:response regulator [Kofleriaceae bacterium]
MGAHVLVVDDDPHILRMLSDVLGKRGFSIDTAKDGEEAYERAVARAPDLLVTDVMMPRLDGWSLVRKLRLEPQLATLPVIFLTALGGEDDRIKAFRLGADDYVNKPFKLNDIVARVEKLLAAKGEAAPAAAPAAAKQTPSSGLSGDLAQVGLSTLLVLIEMERKTGVMALTAADGRAGKMAVRDGKVLDAQADAAGSKRTGADAVYQMLTWSEGKFAFTARDVEMEDKIRQSTTGLLMEGARLMDEAKAPEAETQLNDDAIAEWHGADERTPVVAAAKLADFVRRSARASLPPYTGFSSPGIKLPPIDDPVMKADFTKPVEVAKPEPAKPEPEKVEPAKAVDVAKPEPAKPEPAKVPAAARRSPVWLILALLVAGAGAATFAIKPSAKKGEAVAVDVRGDAAAIGAALDRGADAAQMRATGFASMPLLRTGIETDAATLKDMAADEALFQPGAGEVIEIFQTRDGAKTSLMRTPTDAHAIALDAKTRVATANVVEVMATAPIKSQQGADAGTVAIAVAVDLKDQAAALASRVTGAKLVGLERPVELVPGAAGTSQTVPVSSKVSPNLSLVVTTNAVATASPAALPGWVAPARYGAFALAGLFLLLYLVLRTRPAH